MSNESAGTSADSDVTNDEVSQPIEAGPFRLDPSKDIPVVSGSVPSEDEWDELDNIAVDAANLGAGVVTYAADPLNFLIGAGLQFLIDVLQPLEDALGLVTGNPERMAAEIAKWERVGAALAPLADEIRAAADNELISWKGEAADAAKNRLHEFSDGVAGVGNDVGQIVKIMSIAKLLMEVAQAFVISVIATLVEWLIYTWTAALASSVVTFGGSVAAAGTATSVRVGMAIQRVARFITKVVNILKRLRLVLTRMHPRMMSRVQASFQRRGPGGQFAPGWKGSSDALQRTFSDWRTYLGTAVKSVDAAATDHGRSSQSAGNDDEMSDAEIDEALAKDR